MNTSEKRLRLSLREAGYDDAAISAVWPDWWSSDAAESLSAQAELRFSMAKRLGLDPRRLLENDEPVFVWKGESKFKHLRSTSQWERDALSSFGISVGRVLTDACGQSPSNLIEADAQVLRSLLKTEERPFIELIDVLTLCWSLNIPVIQLRVFPTKWKRMSAMCIRTSSGFAILVGKSAQYPAPIAFYVAHELAHIVLGHLTTDLALVDMGDRMEESSDTDNEEILADRWALELLTGMQSPRVDSETAHFNAAQLASNVLKTGPALGIDPGLLALCCGFTTGRWPVVMATLQLIYNAPKPVWKVVNLLANDELDWERLSSASVRFLRTVMELDS